ncbi:MAG TPA: hypothetical protein VFO05_08410 [Candidatus Limnocylindrales bacterium]|nr:hypothetical protein [Candidatus Limnocylindrales bacterium]
MPLNFLRRKKSDEPTAAVAAPAAPKVARTGVAFDGLTEEWHLVGRMNIDGRLSDSLNKREAIEIHDVQWAPIDGSTPLSPAPGLRSVDPYDLILVLAGEGTLPELTEAEKAAHRVHKIAYDVALEAPPFRVLGTVLMHPGSEPDRLLDRATEMFVAVIDAQAFLGDQEVAAGEVDTVLVNRFYLRGVEQVDKRTGLKHQKLPGAPLGGTSWQDKS